MSKRHKTLERARHRSILHRLSREELVDVLQFLSVPDLATVLLVARLFHEIQPSMTHVLNRARTVVEDAALKALRLKAAIPRKPHLRVLVELKRMHLLVRCCDAYLDANAPIPMDVMRAVADKENMSDMVLLALQHANAAEADPVIRICQAVKRVPELVGKKGGVPGLAKLFATTEQHSLLRKVVVNALTSVATADAASRDQFRVSGILDAVIRLGLSPLDYCWKRTLGLLDAMCRGNATNSLKVGNKLLEKLLELAFTQRDEVAGNALKVITTLLGAWPAFGDRLRADRSLVPRLLEAVVDRGMVVATHSMFLVRLLCGSPTHIKLLVDAGGVHMLMNKGPMVGRMERFRTELLALAVDTVRQVDGRAGIDLFVYAAREAAADPDDMDLYIQTLTRLCGTSEALLSRLCQPFSTHMLREAIKHRRGGPGAAAAALLATCLDSAICESDKRRIALVLGETRGGMV